MQVGDSISCAVYDVEAGGVPLLTQRLPEEADDELAELADEMDQVGPSSQGVGCRVLSQGLGFRVLSQGLGFRVGVQGVAAVAAPASGWDWLKVGKVCSAAVKSCADTCAVAPPTMLTRLVGAVAAPVPVLLCAALAPQIEDIDEISDALLIQGLWAAAEQVDEDEEGPAPNADVVMEELAPLQVRGTPVMLPAVLCMMLYPKCVPRQHESHGCTSPVDGTACSM